MIKIALPKGRIAKESLALFEQLYGGNFVFDDRKLILEHNDFTFLLVRSQDVPTYVVHQAADVGIVGLDVIEEQQANLVRLLNLGIGKCKVVVGSPVGKSIDYQKPKLKIATKMPHITRKYFANKAVSIESLKLYGSIELAPLVGLSDAIVDIVETGTTLKENGLEVYEKIMPISARVIVNTAGMKLRRAEIDDFLNRIEAVKREADV